MKKAPLRVIFTAIVGLVILLVGLWLLSRLLINHSFIKNYNDGNYSTQSEEKLTKLNFPESYVPYYNLGDVAFKRGDYVSAVSYFTQALTMYPPEKRECQIRINLALAMCNTIDFNDLDSQEKIDTAIFMLYKARDVLLEKGCAKDGDEPGHNADAQQLKEDIDKMIERLKNPETTPEQDQPQDPGNSGGDDGNSGGEGGGPSDKEKKIQKDLEKNKKDALEDRKDQQDNLGKWSDYIGGDKDSESGSGEGDGESDGEGDGNGSGGYTKPW